MSGRLASEVFFDLQDIADDLRELDESGRVSMANNCDNADYADRDEAMRLARVAVQVAINATRWMKTGSSSSEVRK
jgi:hypothetical protein